MGTTTNGVICYGIQFDEDTEFPWDDKEYEGENYDGDIDRWWLYDVLGFKHSFEIYGDDGNYIDGKEPSTEDYLAYAAESRTVTDANPLPVELVNYCSANVPMYILAVPSTIKRALRGYPTWFDPVDLTVTDDEKAQLLAFCNTHGIVTLAEPQWWLSSYWG